MVFQVERTTFIYLANWMHSKSFIWMGVLSWKNYLRLLADWMHSNSFIWMGVPTWKNYLHLLANWMHSKSFICHGVPSWKNYLHLLANWMHSKSFIRMDVRNWENDLHLLADWMHSKSFIWMNVPSWKNYLHLLANWMHSKSLIWIDVATWKNYLHLFGELNALQKLDFNECSNLKELPSSIWRIECIPKAWFEWMFQLERTTFIYLANWMHSKSLIWMNVPTWKNYFHLFGQFNALQKLDLRRCSNLKNYRHLLTNWKH
jgi:hypothetical protein